MNNENTARGNEGRDGTIKQKIFECLKNPGGSVLPMILLMGAAGIVSVLALIQYIQPLASSFARNSEMILYRVAMDGLLDYSIGAIKQNKCFNNTMMWVDCVDLTSPYNTERLLMSSESVDKIAMSNTTPIPAAPLTTTLPLRNMEFDFEILSTSSPITAAHPLSAIIEPIKFKLQDGTYKSTHSIKSVRIVISRVTDINVPQNDNFALLKFSVTLTPDSVSTFFNTSTLSAESIVIFSPRKLAGNALVLANNMDLTGDGTSTATDSKLPSFGSLALGGKGIRFESPVIINQNLILPSPTGSVFSPVSFTDKVYLGGRMYHSSIADTNLSKPIHSGHPSERYYSQYAKTHGFMGGVDLDPFPDGGLPYLFNSGAANVPNDSLNRCLARSKVLTDKTVTRESRLYTAFRGVTDLAGSSRRFDFYLSLGQINFFIPQTTPLGADIGVGAESSDAGIVSPTILNSTISDPNIGFNSDYPIARVKVKVTNFTHPSLPPTWPAFSEFFVAGNVGRNGVLTMPLGNGSAIQVAISPNSNNGRFQTGEVQMSITMVNQTAMLTVMPNRAVSTCPGMPWSPSVSNCDPATPPEYLQYAITSYEPARIVVDVEAFDVAYRNGNTQRMLSIPGDRESSAAHPFFGSMKRQQFVFTRGINSSIYNLAQGPTARPISSPTARTWVECSTESAINPRADYSVGATAGDLANCVYPGGMLPYFPAGEEILHKPLVAAVDLETIYDNCRITVPPGSAFSPSFGALAWYYSAAQAPDMNDTQKKDVIRHAWGFVPGYNNLSPPDPVLGAPGSTDQGYIEKLTFNDNSSKVDSVNIPAFIVQSRVQTCTVESTANFVTGLFVCDKFVIKPRTTPLRIIGTVITGELAIDETAVQQGIRWSSVFSANSMYELQRAGILNSLGSCTSAALPHWYPKATAKQLEQLNYCLPGYLTNQVDPFNWTMVDPDCIRDPNNPAKMICKRHPRRYVAREITRNYTP